MPIGAFIYLRDTFTKIRPRMYEKYTFGKHVLNTGGLLFIYFEVFLYALLLLVIFWR